MHGFVRLLSHRVIRTGCVAVARLQSLIKLQHVTDHHKFLAHLTFGAPHESLALSRLELVLPLVCKALGLLLIGSTMLSQSGTDRESRVVGSLATSLRLRSFIRFVGLYSSRVGTVVSVRGEWFVADWVWHTKLISSNFRAHDSFILPLVPQAHKLLFVGPTTLLSISHRAHNDRRGLLAVSLAHRLELLCTPVSVRSSHLVADWVCRIRCLTANRDTGDVARCWY
jgi:hypothetical protein